MQLYKYFNLMLAFLEVWSSVQVATKTGSILNIHGFVVFVTKAVAFCVEFLFT